MVWSCSWSRGGSCALAAAAVLLSVGFARADEPITAPPLERADLVDRTVNAEDDGRHAIDRTWLYGDDARIPLPLALVATSSFSYTNVGGSPTRVTSLSP